MYLCTVLYVLYASSTVLVRGGGGGGGSIVLYSVGCLDGVGFRREGPGHALSVLYLCRIERLSVAGCRLGGACCFSRLRGKGCCFLGLL